MKKIELKHLAPYLPYVLKAKKYYRPHHNQSNLMSEEVIVKGIQETKYGLEIHSTFTGYSNSAENHKPILRPLSDLTKEIEHNGEKFVPAEILYKIGGEGRFDPFKQNESDYKGKFDYIQDIEDGVNRIVIKPIQDERYSEMEICWSDGQVNLHKNLAPACDTHIYSCFEQYRLFTSLFQWHFDVFGLIDEGLAIDINTVE